MASSNEQSCFEHGRDDLATPNAAAHGPLYGDKLEPIAVVGISLRFPQDADSIEGFWSMLVGARSAMTEVPQDRYNLDAFYNTDSSRAATLNIRGGHFLKEDIAGFDAPFFNINASEAACMDPQQRGLLETSYRALENAGIPVSQASKTNTSVYVGSFTREYEAMLMRDPEMQVKYMATGTGTAMLANRLSWFYDFRGPSIPIDTACSSSLIAVHLACQSLRSGESEMSLVGGSNLFFNPDSMLSLANLNFLSTDSRCFSFDHRANGYSRGEGFGMMVLKPLSAALRDSNMIRAVIRATGTNQDGRTPGITQPSSQAQQDLIRATYQNAGLDLKTTRFFEAHGTGTPTGDPLEAQAIGAVFGPYCSAREPLIVGAVKSNIGHLEGASGVAGLIKSILVLENGLIPPNINFEKPNPKLKLEEWNIKFPLETMQWPSQGIRRVSINSFGFGGSNSHVVMDDALHYLQSRGLSGHHCTKPSDSSSNGHYQCLPGKELASSESTSTQSPRLVVLSAADDGGVHRQRQNYQKHIANLYWSGQESSAYFENLVYTLKEKRSALSWRGYTVADGIAELLKGLEEMPKKSTKANSTTRLAFVFTGQGAQWSGMGKDLMAYPAFQYSVEAADEFLAGLGSTWSVKSVICAHNDSPDLNRPDISQTTCTVLQVALVDLLESWNVHPVASIGHSSGEIAAAYSSGLVSRMAAWRIAYCRGTVSYKAQKLTDGVGAMMAVGLGKEEIYQYIQKLQQDIDNVDVTIACINSPRNVTLSGRQETLQALDLILTQSSIFHRMLRTGNAYHSSYMKGVAALYQELMIGLDALPPDDRTVIPMYSTVTGAIANRAQVSSPDYWVGNLVSPVQFSAGLSQLLQQQTSNGPHLSHLLEIGPGPALRRSVEEIVSAESMGTGYLATLQPKQSSHRSMLSTAGALFAMGYPIDLRIVNSPKDVLQNRKLLVDLPEYAFNHSTKHWLESRVSKEFRFRTHPVHELLGARVKDFNPLAPRWRIILRQDEMPWIVDHKVNGNVIYPAAGMLVMAIEAARQLFADDRKDLVAIRLKNVQFPKAMDVPEGSEGLETNICLRPRSEKRSSLDWFDFEVVSYTHGQWQINCKGLVGGEQRSKDFNGTRDKMAPETISKIQEIEEKCSESVDTPVLYQKLDDFGYGFGPTFQTLASVRYDYEGNSIGIMGLKDWTKKLPQSILPHLIHPTALDAMIQSMFPALSAGGTRDIPTLVPTQIGEMWLSTTLLEVSEQSSLKLATNSVTTGLRETLSQVTAYDDSATICAWIQDLHTTVVAQTKTSGSDGSTATELAFRIQWQPDHTLLANDKLQEHCSRLTLSPTKETSARIEEIETACLIYMRRAFAVISESDVSIHQPHLIKYYRWIEHQLNRFASRDLLYKGILTAGIIGNKEREDALLARLENGNIEAKVCTKMGQHLVNILSGQEDGLAVVFGDSMISEYYSWSITAEGKFQKIANLLELMTHKNPSMRILELGAGTGSGADAFLNVISPQYRGESAMARYSHFTFTDISPSFFEKAKERFVTEQDRMDYKILDASVDPELQGFELASYDLILAVNIIHATPDLTETLRNTRKLLKPGGKLMLLEICNTEINRVGFIFGSISGWWASTEPERKWGPLLSQDDWSTYLIKAGFSGVNLSLQDAMDTHNHYATMMVSTRIETIIANGFHTRKAGRLAVVADANSELQHLLARELSSQITFMNEIACDIIAPDTPTAHDCVIYLPELETPTFTTLSEARYMALKRMAESSKLVVWASKNTSTGENSPSFGAVSGWARSIRSEYGNLNLVTVAIQNTTAIQSVAETILAVFRTNLKAGLDIKEEEYEEYDSMLWIPRISRAPDIDAHVDRVIGDIECQPLPAKSAQPMELAISTPGILSTIHFVPTQALDLKQLANNEVEIEVSATGLNYQDIIVLLGRQTSKYVGLECAGVVRALPDNYIGDLAVGTRVCGMAEGSFKNVLRTNLNLVVPIPDHLSFTQAAGYPLVFWTAYYSIIEIGQLSSGDKLLIHSGAGGVGQAAIQLAKLHTTVENIFVTVSSETKRDLLVERYELLPSNILHSQSIYLSHDIKGLTNGYGVDLVLNSLGGEALRRSLDCVAPFGHFVEIGLKDAATGSILPMQPFAGNVSYSSVNLADIMRYSPQRLKSTVQKATALLQMGHIHPHIADVYKYSKLEDAFHLLQTGKSLGKLVAEICEGDEVMGISPRHAASRFDAHSTYVISGMGGLGRRIATWMVDRGCRNLLFLSRSGDKSSTTSSLMTRLRAKGVRVEAPPCDVSDARSLAIVLENVKTTLPPIKGCIQGAMVLRDGIFENLSLEDFQAALAPKIAGSWNLHTLLPSRMDFFILLSSLNGVFGTRGQSNYAAGNTYQDALAKYRVSHGEKAVVIDPGKINSAGYIAERENTISYAILQGYKGIEIDSLLAVLDYYCDPALPVLQRNGAQVILGIESPAVSQERGEDAPWWTKRAMSRILNQMEANKSRTSGTISEATKDYRTLAKDAPDTMARLEIVLEAVKIKLSRVLSAAVEDFDDHQSMNSYGIDSLVAVEIKNWVQTMFQTKVTVFEILANTSMKDFCQSICGQLSEA